MGTPFASAADLTQAERDVAAEIATAITRLGATKAREGGLTPERGTVIIVRAIECALSSAISARVFMGFAERAPQLAETLDRLQTQQRELEAYHARQGAAIQ
ncbi:MAG: hypothetical protein ACOY5Y_07160 [Pseudomonadota bacterium]